MLSAFWQNLQVSTGMGSSLTYLALAFVGAWALVVAIAPRVRRRMATSLLMFAAAAGCLIAGALLLSNGLTIESGAYRWTRFVGLALFSVAFINVAGALVFDVVLTGLRLRPPAIVSDLLIALSYVGALITLLGAIGVNLTGIVATSAVVTAVIGFSLQDTLGNVMGGMAVQLDRSIHVGDWIRVGELEGCVMQIRWRHTAIETRDWDTVLIPNSQIVKSAVKVLGRRMGEPVQHRQWVYFNVDYRHSPTEVIDAVESALRGQVIPLVAREPAPHCIMVEFDKSYGQYAVRYWITDLGPTDPTNSAVRGVIYAGLKRAGISPSIPAASLFITEEDSSRKDRKEGEELARRVKALAEIDLFDPLTDEERRDLANRLRTSPFVRGETIVRQGSKGDWLYIIARGSAQVKVASDDGVSTRTIATLRTGEFFGEMGLMTGGERTATVVAETDVTCYRVDKAELVEILMRRPEVAEGFAQVLAKRKAELEAAREGLNEEAMKARMRREQTDLLRRIRRFFAMD